MQLSKIIFFIAIFLFVTHVMGADSTKADPDPARFQNERF